MRFLNRNNIHTINLITERYTTFNLQYAYLNSKYLTKYSWKWVSWSIFLWPSEMSPRQDILYSIQNKVHKRSINTFFSYCGSNLQSLKSIYVSYCVKTQKPTTFWSSLEKATITTYLSFQVFTYSQYWLSFKTEAVYILRWKCTPVYYA